MRAFLASLLTGFALSFQARTSLLKISDIVGGLTALNRVKDTDTAFARISECTRYVKLSLSLLCTDACRLPDPPVYASVRRAAVDMWAQSPQSVGHVDSGPLTAQAFVKNGYRRTACPHAHIVSNPVLPRLLSSQLTSPVVMSLCVVCSLASTRAQC